MFSACSSFSTKHVDRLNDISYSYHYRDLDSAMSYAKQALDLCMEHDADSGEAINNMAFVSIIRMDYPHAETLLQSAEQSDSRLERYIAYIQHMRLCQRRSDNTAFYLYLDKAKECRKMISQDSAGYSARQQKRLLYAHTEFAIVNSTYYYYVGLLNTARIQVAPLYRIDILSADTAQYLGFLYHIGSGGMVEGSPSVVHKEECENLQRCISLAKSAGLVFFHANSLESLAEHLMDTDMRQADSCAHEALRLFTMYGDVYQVAGAYRTCASIRFNQGCYTDAVAYLNKACANPLIHRAPDLMASIYEQFSLAYSALDMKPRSDYYRNKYLDLQQNTRQDRYYESRIALLHQLSASQRLYIILTLIIFILLIAFIIRARHLSRTRYDMSRQQREFQQLLEQREEEHQTVLFEKKEQYEELGEKIQIDRCDIESGLKKNVEFKAKFALVNATMSLIERLNYTVDKSASFPEGDDRLQGVRQYLNELVEQIRLNSSVLTKWITMGQGSLDIHVESFPLQELFDIIRRNGMSFSMQGKQLVVDNTDAVVKADKTLTLFMLNTLTDNARKFTSEGGVVRISAVPHPDYVEISVADTGCGMSEEKISEIFQNKLYHGSGFGLVNCRAIIDKYRKTSKLFDVCMMNVQSVLHQGSRFYFRLPRGASYVVSLLLGLLGVCNGAGATQATYGDSLNYEQALRYADSAYQCNLNGRYEQTLAYGDSCLQYVNNGDAAYHSICLDVRNEMAVAALALHRWDVYHYQNALYTRLFKELSSDSSLKDYHSQTQAHKNRHIMAQIILALLLLSFVPLYYFLYYRRKRLYIQRVTQPFSEHLRQQEQRHAADIDRQVEAIDRLVQQDEMLSFEASRYRIANSILENCLSTIKHETSYYPDRILSLLREGGVSDAVKPLVNYYHALYSMLTRQSALRTASISLPVVSCRPKGLEPLFAEIEKRGGTGVHLLGSEVLLTQLFDLLRPAEVTLAEASSFGEMPHHTFSVTFRATFPGIVNTGVVDTSCMSPSGSFTEYTRFMVCSQIVRLHAEATGQRNCGIKNDEQHNHSVLLITLPAIRLGD
ncbi:MAG: DUF5112 domain-containing protein [Prevotella sp.]